MEIHTFEREFQTSLPNGKCSGFNLNFAPIENGISTFYRRISSTCALEEMRTDFGKACIYNGQICEAEMLYSGVFFHFFVFCTEHKYLPHI